MRLRVMRCCMMLMLVASTSSMEGSGELTASVTLSGSQLPSVFWIDCSQGERCTGSSGSCR